MSGWAIAGQAAADIGSTIFQSERNKSEARKNREFQERMSSTAHQREVQDLLAAGLNPVLSALGGSGAATPAGAMSSIENPRIGSGISNLILSNMRKEGKKADAEINKLIADTNLSYDLGTSARANAYKSYWDSESSRLSYMVDSKIRGNLAYYFDKMSPESRDDMARYTLFKDVPHGGPFNIFPHFNQAVQSIPDFLRRIRSKSSTNSGQSLDRKDKK